MASTQNDWGTLTDGLYRIRNANPNLCLTLSRIDEGSFIYVDKQQDAGGQIVRIDAVHWGGRLLICFPFAQWRVRHTIGNIYVIQSALLPGFYAGYAKDA